MKNDIIEKASRLLPDYKVHPKDTINISILKIDADKQHTADPDFNYCYSVKFKKIYEDGEPIAWAYVSMSLGK